MHNNVPTGKVLGSKGLSLNPLCTLCHKSNESIDHLHRGYAVGQKFWQSLKVPHCLMESFNQTVGVWIEANCKAGVVSNFMGIPWKILFLMGIWKWLHGNNFVFKTRIIDRSIHVQCIKSRAEFFSIGTKCKTIRPKNIVLVSWEKPPEGWMKLNTDGSALGNPGKVGGGGLIQNHHGDWIRGYAKALDNTNSFMVELWALRDGLAIAKELGLNNLIVEMDA